MDILLLFSGFIFAFAVILMYEVHLRKLYKKLKNKNNVHFYVARDRYNNILYLYLGKPRRDTDRFHSNNKGSIVEREGFLYNFGLNVKDFENLKFSDEPVEVFLDLD